MRWNCWNVLGLVVLLLTGCASRQKADPTSFPTTGQSDSRPPKSDKSINGQPNGPTIVTPAQSGVGRVSLVNASLRYVVVTYTVGRVPTADSRLQVYRAGLKVAELKVTDFPPRDLNAVADVLVGECQVGDEVRDN